MMFLPRGLFTYVLRTSKYLRLVIRITKKDYVWKKRFESYWIDLCFPIPMACECCFLLLEHETSFIFQIVNFCLSFYMIIALIMESFGMRMRSHTIFIFLFNRESKLYILSMLSTRFPQEIVVT